jgi:phage/plasmid-like protein (TIGR03299 family)
MAYVGEVPWHGLGVQVEAGLSGEAFLQAAGLDWTVDLKPIMAVTGIDTAVEIDGHFAIMRNDRDEPLTVVGRKYTPIQNHEAFALPDVLIQDGLATYETAGSLNDGRVVWSLALLGESAIARLNGESDKIRDYLLFATSHDGSQSTTLGLTRVRVVCQNTLGAALGRNGERLQDRVKVRHTRSAPERIEQAHKGFVELIAARDEENQLLQYLAQKPMSQQDFRFQFAEPWLDGERGEVDADSKRDCTEREKAIDLLENFFLRGQGNSGESAWDAYNSVTEYLDHVRRQYKDAAKAAANHTTSTLFGVNRKAKTRALRLLAR